MMSAGNRRRVLQWPLFPSQTGNGQRNSWSNFSCKPGTMYEMSSTLCSRQVSTRSATQKPSKPLHYHVPLFPGVQLLDIAGPLDILSLRSQYPETSGISLTLLSSTLEPVSTKPVPPPSAKWDFDLPCGTNKSFNPRVVPDATFDDYLIAVAQRQISDDASGIFKPIDVLLIPGGPGTRLDRIESGSERSANTKEVTEFIKAVASKVRHSVITICTGSHVLAMTGLLNGLEATTNSARFKDVSTANHLHNRKIIWKNNKRWVRSRVLDDFSIMPNANTSSGGLRPGVEVWSSAGITAGMDLMLEFVKAHYGGEKVALETAKRLEYRWEQTDQNFVEK